MKWTFYILILISLAFITSCEYEQLSPSVDCSTSGPTVSLSGKEDSGCGLPTGSVTLSATGGSGDYTFSSPNSGSNATGIFTNIAAGNYMFFATDGLGCTDTVNVQIKNIGGVRVTSTTVRNAGCKTSNGSIVIQVEDGSPPYSYKLDDGNFQSGNTFSNLSAGKRQAVVKDDIGCEFTQETVVLSGVTFAGSISSIISSNCAISGCHNGSQFPDFRKFENIQGNAQNIKTRTGNRSMPQGRTLSQSQINEIACWVDDGAMNN